MKIHPIVCSIFSLLSSICRRVLGRVRIELEFRRQVVDIKKIRGRGIFETYTRNTDELHEYQIHMHTQNVYIM